MKLGNIHSCVMLPHHGTIINDKKICLPHDIYSDALCSSRLPGNFKPTELSHDDLQIFTGYKVNGS